MDPSSVPEVIDDVVNHNTVSVIDELENTVSTPQQHNIVPSNYDAYFSRIQNLRYMCCACGDKVLEQYLAVHHSENHSELTFIMDMYEVFEIDELVECLMCNATMFEEHFKDHMQSCHPKMESQTINHSSPSKEAIKQTPIGYYNCKLCDAGGIKEQNLEKHHFRAHPHVPSNVDIFDFTYLKIKAEKVKCDTCGKSYTEKSLKKHRLKRHPENGRENSTDQRFRPIFVSDKEFELMQGQNRLYEIDGHMYLRDH